MITIKQIETLQQVAALGSIARAAEKLCTTESAVSKRLQALERALGTPLFDRQRRAMALTDMGHTVLRMGRRLLAQCDAIVDLARSPSFQGRTFRFGMTELIATNWLTALVDGIHSAYEHVDLEPRIGLTGELVQHLLERELDLIVVPSPQSHAGLVVEPLFESRNVWVCSPQLELGARALTPATLGRHALILQPSSSVLHASVVQWFADHNAMLPRLILCNSLAGVKSLAIAGFGVVSLPEAFCQAEIASGALRVLDVQPPLPARNYCAVRLPGADEGLAARMSLAIQGIMEKPAI